MCRRVACERCNKATFAGCGMHVEQVLGGVPEAERCSCRAQPRSAQGGAASGDKAPWWKMW